MYYKMSLDELQKKYFEEKTKKYNKLHSKKEESPLPLLSNSTQRYGVIYTRVSTNMQVETGHSLAAQQQILTEYCKNNNILIVNHYTDEGISGGTIEKREGLKKMLLELRPGFVVLCTAVSRLSRNTQQLLQIHEEINLKKGQLILLDVNVDTQTPVGRLMLTLLAGYSQMEKEQIQGRISDVMQNMSANGTLKTKPRYGYTRKNGELIEVADEQVVITTIRALVRAYPGINVNKISSILTTKGYTNRRGNKFHPSTVLSIIQANDIPLKNIEQYSNKLKQNKPNTTDEPNDEKEETTNKIEVEYISEKKQENKESLAFNSSHEYQPYGYQQYNLPYNYNQNYTQQWYSQNYQQPYQQTYPQNNYQPYTQNNYQQQYPQNNYQQPYYQPNYHQNYYNAHNNTQVPYSEPVNNTETPKNEGTSNLETLNIKQTPAI